MTTVVGMSRKTMYQLVNNIRVFNWRIPIGAVRQRRILKRTQIFSWRYGFRLMRDPASVLRYHNTAQEVYK